MSLWLKIIIGLFAGVVTGSILGTPATVYLQPIGDVFLGLIQMLIVPLIFSSITVGISSIRDTRKLGRVGLKAFALYMATTVLAIFIGLLFAHLFQSGKGIIQDFGVGVVSIGSTPSLKEIFMSMIPKNPVGSLASGNILQVIVFALFFGVAINFSGERGRSVLRVCESLAEIMYKLTEIVMNFAPIGVFGIMAGVSGKFGLSVLIPLLKFVICYYAAAIVHMVLVYGGMLVVLAKLNPIRFFRGMGDAIALAFSTSSSAGTLPVSLHCVQENLGVSRNITNFVMPIGATINMNGSAMFQAAAAIFIAQAFGLDIGWQTISLIVLMSVLCAIGAAGSPGSGVVMLSVVLRSSGFPVGIIEPGIGLLFGIDRIREMISTVVNVLGDSVVAVYVAKTEGELNEDQYNHAELVKMDEFIGSRS